MNFVLAIFVNQDFSAQMEGVLINVLPLFASEELAQEEHVEMAAKPIINA